jgi:hypothetical protein
LLSIYKDNWTKIGVTLVFDAKDNAVYTSMVAARSYKQAALAATSTHVAFNLNEVRDPKTGPNNRSWVVWSGGDEAYNQIWANYMDWNKQCQIFKDITPYILRQNWLIPTPSYYWYTLWQPWLKNYHGEFSVGSTNPGNWTKWVWIDQDMREKATGIR